MFNIYLQHYQGMYFHRKFITLYKNSTCTNPILQIYYILITQYTFALISTTLILVLFVCRTCAAQSDQPWGWGILLPETYRSPRYHLSISFWLWVIKRQYHRKTIREINHWPRSLEPLAISLDWVFSKYRIKTRKGSFLLSHHD